MFKKTISWIFIFSIGTFHTVSVLLKVNKYTSAYSLQIFIFFQYKIQCLKSKHWNLNLPDFHSQNDCLLKSAYIGKTKIANYQK